MLVCFFDRPHGTALKIYQNYDCKTLMHVYNYLFVHSTDHASPHNQTQASGHDAGTPVAMAVGAEQ